MFNCSIAQEVNYSKYYKPCSMGISHGAHAPE